MYATLKNERKIRITKNGRRVTAYFSSSTHAYAGVGRSKKEAVKDLLFTAVQIATHVSDVSCLIKIVRELKP